MILIALGDDQGQMFIILFPYNNITIENVSENHIFFLDKDTPDWLAPVLELHNVLVEL